MEEATKVLGAAARGGSPEARSTFPHFPELKTERLHLREVTLADADWYLAHFSRPEIVHATGCAAPADLEAAREELSTYFVRLFEQSHGLRWGIALRGAPDLIGSIGFYKWVQAPIRQAELGYDLEPAWWGKGVMSEAMHAALEFGFGEMALERVEAFVITSNERSARLLERAHFVREGLLREHGLDEHGQPCDEFRYALSRARAAE